MNTTPRDTIRERLYYIDFLAFFTGQVTRRDLVERFGISEPAATKDLAQFAEVAPHILQYDVRQKCYVLASESPFFEHNVDQALHSLSGDRAISFNTGHAHKLSSWIAWSIKRCPDIRLVATLTRALYQRRMVEAIYFSLEHGADAPRLLSPVAVVHDGARWHFRCYSHDKEEFRDYNLSRFLKADERGGSDKKIEDDALWSTPFTLELIPHPKAPQPDAIRIDYGIEGEMLAVTTPLCIAPYFLQHWRIDVTQKATKSPAAHHLYLRNRQAAIESGMPQWIFRSGDEDEWKAKAP